MVHVFPLFAALRSSVPNAVDRFFSPLSDIQTSGFRSRLENKPLYGPLHFVRQLDRKDFKTEIALIRQKDDISNRL